MCVASVFNRNNLIANGNSSMTVFTTFNKHEKKKKTSVIFSFYYLKGSKPEQEE